MGCVYNEDTSAKANSFYKLMTSFDFCSSSVINRSIIDLTLPVNPPIDIADAAHLIYILELDFKVDIEESKPRTSKLQRNRNDVQSETISNYFKKIVTVPLLDHLTTGIEERFDHASILVYNDLLIISSKMISLIYKKVNWKKNYFFADILKVIFHVPKC